ncbi:MAG: hypothetical protein LBM00_12345 [Deltaproteobacteria bacterium]|jgi:hypothetical protein|nr:hypothetical protein [Deltaproteobacteria bacterium]
MRNFIWWIFYIFAAIWLQKFAPGLDALAPGLIICMQERNRQQSILFLLVCIVLQEGCGTLPFGASIIWYGLVFSFFYMGGWFFMAENRFFIMILSLALGIGRLFMFLGMGALQPLPLDTQALWWQCAAQAVFTPVIWAVSGYSRHKFCGEAD